MTFKAVKSALSQLALAVASALTVFFTARHVEPIFLGRQPVVRTLLQTPADSALPVLAYETPSDSVMNRPTFPTDRERFAQDLIATGKISRARAEELATYAVREAYKRDVPPALVFGVMLVENDEFKSSARSSQGAVGLMQIAPRVWVKSLGKLFGRNLRDDETNIQYGVYILSALVHENSARRSTEAAVRRGLLRYNGCVRGRNTPNCHRYPELVRRRIEQYARAQCGQIGYAGCVTAPMRSAIAERTERRLASRGDKLRADRAGQMQAD
jgi:soluble lytic murein transglycosylase-like protein